MSILIGLLVVATLLFGAGVAGVLALNVHDNRRYARPVRRLRAATPPHDQNRRPGEVGWRQ